MAKGHENLIDLRDRTTEEQREIARKGGIASGKARRERKTLKEELILMLEDEEIQQKISLALITRAISFDAMGNKAFEVIRDTIGEKPVEKVEANLTYENRLKEAESPDEY